LRQAWGSLSRISTRRFLARPASLAVLGDRFARAPAFDRHALGRHAVGAQEVANRLGPLQ
jgi:hypothetical protein